MGTESVLTLPPSRPAFLTAATVRFFKATDQWQLHQELRARGATTTSVPLIEPSQLQLTSQGRTIAEGWRLTRPAMSQLCNWLCPGLFRVLVSLIEDSPRGPTEPGKPPAEISQAVQVWNGLVLCRFDRLLRRVLVVNRSAGTIYGALGPQHVQLPNLQFYETITELAAEYGLQFKGAAMVGPRLTLWWQRPETHSVRWSRGDWGCHTGAYVANSEVDGIAVRALPAIYTPLGVVLGGRLRHAGRKFKMRVGRLCSRAMQPAESPHPVLTAAGAVLSESLGFVAGMSADQRDARTRVLSRQLLAAGLPLIVCRDIVQDALMRGVRRTPLEDLASPDRIYPARTTADVLAAILRQARKLDLVRRERMEQVGHRILAGLVRMTPEQE